MAAHSGAAHGLSWAQLSGAARDATDAGNGMAWFGVSANINDSLNPFLLASHLLRFGYMLLTQRSAALSAT